MKEKIIANYFGTGWTALMSFVFTPLYIKYLGPESYGLVGVYAMIQGWMILLDVGLSPTLSREVSMYKAGVYVDKEIKEIFSSIEMIYIVLGISSGFLLIIFSSWISRNWLQINNLSLDVVASSVICFSFLIVFRWVSGLYSATIMGAQDIIWYNITRSIFSTLRGAGVIVVLHLVLSDIRVFFVYQAIIVLFELIVLRFRILRILPSPKKALLFSLKSISKIWKFAGGMAVITFLGIMLKQIDKIMLSKMMSLTEFGYYSLASVVSGIIILIVQPIINIAYPVIAELRAKNKSDVEVIKKYHFFSQMVSIVSIPIGLFFSLYSVQILTLWIGDKVIVDKISSIVSIMVLGNVVNNIMIMPYLLQISGGWTSLSLWSNIIYVIIFGPVIYFGYNYYGLIMVPIAWLVINVINVIFQVQVMHKKIYCEEMGRWYYKDIGIPFFVSSLILIGSKILFYKIDIVSNVGVFLYLFLVLIVTILCSLIAMDYMRLKINKILNNILL